MKIKKKQKLIKIPIIIISGVLILIIGAVGFLRCLLPFKSAGALMVSGLNKINIGYPSSLLEWITSGERDYSALPELMLMNNGTEVLTALQFEERKEEIIALFNENVYGEIPRNGFGVTFETVEEGEALGGKAVRKQIKITVSTSIGECSALLLLYIPVSDTLAAVVIGLNFMGNHTIDLDNNIIPSYGLDKTNEKIEEERGIKSGRWPIEMIIDSGTAIATMYYGDWAEDNKKTYGDRVISLFDDDNFRAISAWAFGIMRGVDYLIEDSDIDNNRIADIGHSRLGKTSLWAGVNDERINLVIANGSGCTGAALSRDTRGETIKYITSTFPYWFIDKYKSFGWEEGTLPLDQHMLLAAIAPRKLYIGNAEDDLWADPQGSFNALMYAREAYSLYGIATIPYSKSQPAVNTPLKSESISYHLRPGAHDINEVDWKYYLDCINEYLSAA